MRRTLTVVIILFLFAGILGRKAASANTIEIQILQPRPEERVPARAVVVGKVLGLQSEAHVYILVRALNWETWWVQPVATIGRDGNWEAVCYFGRPGMDFDERYAVLAILNPRDHLLKEGEQLESPPHSVALSNIITVVRETRGAKAESASIVLQGRIDSSSQWGSAWIDLAVPRTFKKRGRLKLTLGGSGIPGKDPAKKVVVRLLAKGEDPNLPVGIITPKGITVPEDRVVELDIPADFPNIVQISVHGGSNPWNQFYFGETNGPAKLIRVELLEPTR